MNRQQRRAIAKAGHDRDFGPVARHLAGRLIATSPEPSDPDCWPMRLTLFRPGIQQIVGLCPPDRRGELENMVDAFAVAVIEACGRPPVLHPEQAIIWTRSNDAAYQQEAVTWLRMQGGHCSVSLLDGKDMTLQLRDDGVMLGEIALSEIWPPTMGRA
jgi:hypothetical protein